MIFEQTQSILKRQDRTAQRLALVANVVDAFRKTFPSLTFRVLDRVTAVNAQASILDDVRFVDLWGGFAYHPAIGKDALVFTLLHETGHHFSKGCRSPWMPEIACDCAADFWAIKDGRAILRKNGCKFDLQSALRQIEVAANLNGCKTSAVARRSICSFLDRKKRKRSLLGAEFEDRENCAIF